MEYYMYAVKDTHSGLFYGGVAPDKMVEFNRATLMDERHANAHINSEVKRWNMYCVDGKMPARLYNEEYDKFATDREHLENYGYEVVKVKIAVEK